MLKIHTSEGHIYERHNKTLKDMDYHIKSILKRTNLTTIAALFARGDLNELAAVTLMISLVNLQG
jgi:hypothetical protein